MSTKFFKYVGSFLFVAVLLMAFVPQAALAAGSTIVWDPSTAYMQKGATAFFVGQVEGGDALQTITFPVRDGSAVDLIARTVSNGHRLAVTKSVNDITLTSVNGQPIGTKISVKVTALADGLVFPYWDTTATTLISKPFTRFNEVDKDGKVVIYSVCQNYWLTDPDANSATLLVLPGTAVASVKSGTMDLTSTSPITNTGGTYTLTVNSSTGLGLGAYVEVCLTGIASPGNQPFGVGMSIKPYVVLPRH